MIYIQILALSLAMLLPLVSPAQKTQLVTLLNLALQRKQSNLVAQKSWPPFLAALCAAVRKRDHAALRQVMPAEFTYDCCVNEDKNGNGETRDEAFHIWDSSKTEGWDALNRLLGQGVVPASAQWTRQNGRSKPNFIAPPSANRDSYDGPIADFEYRNGRWYFVSFQFNEGDDASGQPPPNHTPSPTIRTPSSIQRIDFRNFTYPLDQIYADLYQRKSVRLKNGKFVVARDAEGVEGVAIRKIIYGDLTGDGFEEAVVTIIIGAIDGSESSQQAPGTYAYIYTMMQGSPSLLTIFDAEPENSDAQIYYRDSYRDNTMLFYPSVNKVANGLLVVESLAGTGRGFPKYQVAMMLRWDGQRFILAGKPERKRMSR